MSEQPVLILVGGGRGNWPNFWAVMAYRPRLVYLISPGKDDANTLFAQEFFAAHGIHCAPSGGPIDAYDLQATRERCAALIQSHPSEAVLISVTSSPKMMAFGACYAALDSGRPDVGVFHRDTANSQTCWIAGHVPPPGAYLPTIDDYLAAYRRRAESDFDFNALPCSADDLLAVTRGMGQRLPAYNRILKQIRHHKASSGTGPVVLFLSPRNDPAWQLLSDLSRHGFVTNLMVDDSNPRRPQTRFDLAVNKQVWPFLDGKWLELYAYDQARQFSETPGSPAFHECRFNLKIPNHEKGVENEIDLACLMPNGLFLYASCKTSTAKNPDKTALSDGNLSDVVDRASLLGGQYCGKMLITNASRRAKPPAVPGKPSAVPGKPSAVPGKPSAVPGKPSAAQESIDNFQRQAKERHVTVVYAEDFPNLHPCFAVALEDLRRSGR